MAVTHLRISGRRPIVSRGLRSAHRSNGSRGRPMLSDGERRFLAQQCIAHLATADKRAVPHVVPVCFAILDRTLYITIDEKPKRVRVSWYLFGAPFVTANFW